MEVTNQYLTDVHAMMLLDVKAEWLLELYTLDSCGKPVGSILPKNLPLVPVVGVCDSSVPFWPPKPKARRTGGGPQPHFHWDLLEEPLPLDDEVVYSESEGDVSTGDMDNLVLEQDILE